MNWKSILPLALLLTSATVAFAGKGKGGGATRGGQTQGDDDGGRRGQNDDSNARGGASRDASGGQGRGGVGSPTTGSFSISASSLSVPDPSRIQSRNSGAPYRVGFNMIRKVPGSSLSGAQSVLDDIVDVGGQGIRQIQDGDLTWFSVTNQRGTNFSFAAADTWLQNSQGLYAIPTLFQIGPATAARNWNKSCPDEGASESEYCREPFTPGGEVLNLGKRGVKNDVQTYLDHVATHYRGSGLRHFEIMNEPARYRHFDLAFFYLYRYAPSDYAELLKLASKTIKDVIPNARIVAGGMVYYDNQSTDGRDEMWEDYLDKALRAGADKYIDVYNFHYYGKWKDLQDHIGEVKKVMRRHGVGSKPIWMTEVGSSATNKSPQEQAADVFRFFSVAFGNGVELANWHTHVSSHDGRDNWGGYGTRAAGGRRNLSWYSYKLFASYLGNFGECTPLRQGKGNVWAYRYSGSLYSSQGNTERAYVLWATKDGSSIDLGGDIPGAWSQIEIIEVVPNNNGNFSVTTQAANAAISVGTTPLLVVKH